MDQRKEIEQINRRDVRREKKNERKQQQKKRKGKVPFAKQFISLTRNRLSRQ
jgi:hypothetical protein